MRTKWSQEDENTLLELVENYERKGRTKQEAFEVVANIINRTKTACASRYRTLKKKDLNQSTFTAMIVSENPLTKKGNLSFESVISYLINYESEQQLTEQNNQLQSMIISLNENNQKLSHRIIQLKTTIEKNQHFLKKLVD